ncbi:cytidylate kinase family protein [Candidatus Roizmanbacteria bacterium]|nr:cytidylate kinase family protein [Candidatus Roizmanbacteria bacterium]
MSHKFDNITISGGIAVGTSTLLNNLRPYLKPYHWKFFSGGEFMRDYALKNKLLSPSQKGHPKATVFADDLDRKLDFGMQKRLKSEKHVALESWLSGFMCREIPKTLTILLYCSNDAVRVDRVVNRDRMTIDEAKHYIKERESENFTKWRRLYGDYNFFDPTYYKLVIDTYSSGQLETLGKVLDKLGYNHDQIKIAKTS